MKSSQRTPVLQGSADPLDGGTRLAHAGSRRGRIHGERGAAAVEFAIVATLFFLSGLLRSSTSGSRSTPGTTPRTPRVKVRARRAVDSSVQDVIDRTKAAASTLDPTKLTVTVHVQPHHRRLLAHHCGPALVEGDVVRVIRRLRLQHDHADRFLRSRSGHLDEPSLAIGVEVRGAMTRPPTGGTSMRERMKEERGGHRRPRRAHDRDPPRRRGVRDRHQPALSRASGAAERRGLRLARRRPGPPGPGFPAGDHRECGRPQGRHRERAAGGRRPTSRSRTNASSAITTPTARRIPGTSRSCAARRAAGARDGRRRVAAGWYTTATRSRVTSATRSGSRPAARSPITSRR